MDVSNRSLSFLDWMRDAAKTREASSTPFDPEAHNVCSRRRGDKGAH